MAIQSSTRHKGKAAIDGTGMPLWPGMWTWGRLEFHPVHQDEPYWHVMGQSNDYARALKAAADAAEIFGADYVDLWLTAPRGWEVVEGGAACRNWP